MKRLVRRVLLALIALVVAADAALFAGPLVSGGLFLSWQKRVTPTDHSLPASYLPLHKGYIDISTGLYVREDEDIVLPGTPPFVLRRTYRTEDRVSREFGIGATHNGEWYLYGDGARFKWAELILADGNRVHYDRTSPGITVFNAMYRHWGGRDEFQGSRLGWNGTEWVLREYDGSVGKFLPCGADGTKCAISEWRDSDGHRTQFLRDAAHRLLSVTTGAQTIRFEHDSHGRVVRVTDQAQHAIAYSYDSTGRLRKAAGSDGTIRTYDYDSADRLTRIEEPGRIVENTYDGGGLCVRQVVRSTARVIAAVAQPYRFEVSYKTVGRQIVEADVDESGARRVRYQFTPGGEPASEVYEPDTPAAVVVKYDRDPIDDLVSGVTVSCGSGRWRLVRSLPVPDAGPSEPRTKLLRDCGVRE